MYTMAFYDVKCSVSLSRVIHCNWVRERIAIVNLTELKYLTGKGKLCNSAAEFGQSPSSLHFQFNFLGFSHY